MFIKLVALLGLVFLFTCVTGFFFVKRKLPLPVAALILVLVLGSAVAAILIPSGRAYLNVPMDSPDAAAAAYCSALSGTSHAEPDMFLKDSVFDRELENCESPAAEAMKDAFFAETMAEPVGEAELNWDLATQTVKLYFPDLTSDGEAVCAETAAAMEAIAAERPRSVVYNADKSYQPQIAAEVFDDCACRALTDSHPLLETEVTLQIVCENGEWVIVSDEPILQAAKDVLGAESLSTRFDALAAELEETALQQAQYVPKHFTIPFEDTVAPEPDPARYGITTDPMEVQAVVDAAADLLEGQSLFWSPDREFYPGTDIRYYYDDSILVIEWREEYKKSAVTYAEIKIADASQMKRKMVDDMYEPPEKDWKEATKLSEEVNAVLATGSDLYAFRKLGIVSYGGTLYRCLPNYLDSLHITYDGDFVFSHRYELMDWDECQQWILDNDIMFTLAFGPVLVEDGQPVSTIDYAIGEIWERYPRAAIGQRDKLHYIAVAMGSDTRIGLRRDVFLSDILEVMFLSGCQQAYALDGGQTGAIIIDNEMINLPTYGWERIYCDILYFASAIPEEERLG